MIILVLVLRTVRTDCTFFSHLSYMRCPITSWSNGYVPSQGQKQSPFLGSSSQERHVLSQDVCTTWCTAQRVHVQVWYNGKHSQSSRIGLVMTRNICFNSDHISEAFRVCTLITIVTVMDTNARHGYELDEQRGLFNPNFVALPASPRSGSIIQVQGPGSYHAGDSLAWSKFDNTKRQLGSLFRDTVGKVG
jgi:hypothetical protein